MALDDMPDLETEAKSKYKTPILLLIISAGLLLYSSYEEAKYQRYAKDVAFGTALAAAYLVIRKYSGR